MDSGEDILPKAVAPELAERLGDQLLRRLARAMRGGWKGGGTEAWLVTAGAVSCIDLLGLIVELANDSLSDISHRKKLSGLVAREANTKLLFDGHQELVRVQGILSCEPQFCVEFVVGVYSAGVKTVELSEYSSATCGNMSSLATEIPCAKLLRRKCRAICGNSRDLSALIALDAAGQINEYGDARHQ
jgi:hypothetical protein